MINTGASTSKQVRVKIILDRFSRRSVKNFKKKSLLSGLQNSMPNVDMGGFHTDVTLKGMSEVTFNSVNFEFYLKNAQGEYVLHDIYRDPEYNKVLA